MFYYFDERMMSPNLECIETLIQLKADIASPTNWHSDGVIVFGGEVAIMEYNFNKSFPNLQDRENVEKYISSRYSETEFKDYLGSYFTLKAVHYAFMPEPLQIPWTSSMNNTTLKTLIVRITVSIRYPMHVCKTVLRHPSLNKHSILSMTPDVLCSQIIHQALAKPCRWKLSRKGGGILEIQHRMSCWTEIAKDWRFRDNFKENWAGYMQRELRTYDQALFGVGVGGYVVLHEDRIEWLPGTPPERSSCAII
jgi:hypothetical protein